MTHQKKENEKLVPTQVRCGHVGAVALTWHRWSWERCSIYEEPRLPRRQLRLRTGPLPSVPYPWSAGPAEGAPAAGLRYPDSGVGLYSSPVEAWPAGLTNRKPRAAKSAGRTLNLYNLLPHPFWWNCISAYVWESDHPCLKRSYIQLAPASDAILIVAWKWQKRKKRSPRKNTRGKVPWEHVVPVEPLDQVDGETFNSCPHRWRDFWD